MSNFNFNAALDNIYPALQKVINKEMNTYPIEDREDVLQNTCLKLILYKDSYDSKRPFKRYAIQVLYNEIKDFYFKSKKRTYIDKEYYTYDINPERKILAEEELEEMLQDVTSRDTQILLMYHVEGRSIDNLIELYGLSKSRIYQILGIKQ